MTKSKEEGKTQADRGRTGLGERLLPTVGSRAWRRILAWFFLVLGCLLVPLAVIGVWIRTSVFDTDGFVDTLGPLASDSAIQETVSDVLASRVIEALDLETQLQQVLPDRVEFLAVIAADQLQGWVRSETEAVVASPAFETVWRSALRLAHGTISDFLRGEGPVEVGPGGVVQLDLTPLTLRIVERLELAGVVLPLDAGVAHIDGKIPLVEVEGLEKVQPILRLLDRLFILLPILALAFLLGSVVVNDRRQKAAVRVGMGVMISMAVFVVVLALARVGLVNLITQAGPSGEAGKAIWGDLTIAMRGVAWGLFVLGLLLSIYPRIVRALRGQRLTRVAGKTAEARWARGAVPAWIAAYRMAVAVGILALGVLVLAVWTGPGWVAVVTVAVVVLLLEAVVLVVAEANDIAVEKESQGQETPNDDSAVKPKSPAKPKPKTKPTSKSEDKPKPKTKPKSKP